MVFQSRRVPVYFEYVTPYVVKASFQDIGAESYSRDRFFMDWATAFSYLESDIKGKVKKLGRFSFFSQGYWPLWLTPLTKNHCTIIDGLNLTQEKVPLPEVPSPDNIRKTFKAKKVIPFIKKLKKYNERLEKEIVGLQSKERIDGLFDPQILHYLRLFFLRPIPLYTDNFFLFEPAIRESDVLIEKAKITVMISEKNNAVLRSDLQKILEICDGFVDRCSTKLDTMIENSEIHENLEEDIDELEEKVALLRKNPPQRDLQKGLQELGCYLPEVSPSLENSVRDLSSLIQEVQDAEDAKNLRNFKKNLNGALEITRQVLSELTDIDQEFSTLVTEIKNSQDQAEENWKHELESADRELEKLRSQFQDANSNNDKGLSRRREIFDALLRYREETQKLYRLLLERREEITTHFINELAIPMTGTLQVVGLPVFFFGFEGNRGVDLHPILPKVLGDLDSVSIHDLDSQDSRTPSDSFELHFKRTKPELRFRRYFKKFLRTQEVLDYAISQGKLQDLTKLPNFRENLYRGIDMLVEKQWITPERKGRILKMLDDGFPALEFKERET